MTEDYLAILQSGQLLVCGRSECNFSILGRTISGRKAKLLRDYFTWKRRLTVEEQCTCLVLTANPNTLSLSREHTFIGKVVFKRPLSPTISFWPTQVEGRLLVLWDFCGAFNCNRTGCRHVARYMHDPNGIIDARSASPLAPNLVAAISYEGLWNLASVLLPCNPKYTMRSDILILDRIVSLFGTSKYFFFFLIIHPLIHPYLILQKPCSQNKTRYLRNMFSEIRAFHDLQLQSLVRIAFAVCSYVHFVCSPCFHTILSWCSLCSVLYDRLQSQQCRPGRSIARNSAAAGTFRDHVRVQRRCMPLLNAVAVDTAGWAHVCKFASSKLVQLFLSSTA